jgi:hypothetical protein
VFVVDANFLLHAVNSTSPHHDRARAVLDEWLEGPHAVYLTWGIVYEFLRVSTHRRVFARPLSFTQAVAFVSSLLDSPRVEVLLEAETHRTSLEAAAKTMPAISGSRLHDLHVALLMRENGITAIQTEDADFHRFEGIEPRNPFRGA